MQDRHLGRLAVVGPTDEDRLAAQDRLAEDLQPLAAQSGPGLDDIGDDVSHPRVIAVSTAPSSRTTSASTPEPRQVGRHEAGIRGGDPATRDIGDLGNLTGARGVPEGRGAEVEPEHLDRGTAGVEGRSRPVMPQSTVPDPTYTAISRGRR